MVDFEKAEEDYTAKDIEVLSELEGVRKRPGMYIGSTNLTGLHHLVWEIVDNAVDEAVNGFGDRITVTLEKDGSIQVEDEGRGIPVDVHPQTHIPAIQLIYTTLHSGGKFNSKVYQTSAGLHDAFI
jgi:Type IIA topoisomerase (DNA gyrase/topo II, topoisomerase IV), B subunit